ncbi:MAG: hypothetical protein PVH74_00440 [Desulfobacterales bacterium]|jgi:hypothetical protein
MGSGYNTANAIVLAVGQLMEGWNSGKMGYWVQKLDEVAILLPNEGRLENNRS